MFVIQVSRKGVEKCKEAISDKLVNTWNENVQVMEQRMIKKDMIEQYLKYMQKDYPGMYHNSFINFSSSSPGCLGKVELFYFGTPWAFHI